MASVSHGQRRRRAAARAAAGTTDAPPHRRLAAEQPERGAAARPSRPHDPLRLRVAPERSDAVADEDVSTTKAIGASRLSVSSAPPSIVSRPSRAAEGDLRNTFQTVTRIVASATSSRLKPHLRSIPTDTAEPDGLAAGHDARGRRRAPA